MKILLCSPQPITKNLGISRVLIEIDSQMKSMGYDISLIGPQELGIKDTNFTDLAYRAKYQNKLRDYLIKNASHYDVVDYDHEFLPFQRDLFCKDTLLVARTVLLTQHLRHIHPPKRSSLRSFIGKLKNHRAFQKRLQDADKTIACADLINVPNYLDRKYLIETGVDEKKICVIPYGVSKERISDFLTSNSLPPSKLKIVFLGSFDYRKGAMDFNFIFKELLSHNPDIHLLLLGCKGLFQTEKEILSFFDSHLHKNIEVVMSFQRENISEYLKDCSLGLYPSYMEGFPFGVLEMMCSYIPVFGYDSPGLAMMIPKVFLAQPGNKKQLAKKIISFIIEENLEEWRRKSYESTLQFSWENVCLRMIDEYSKYRK